MLPLLSFQAFLFVNNCTLLEVDSPVSDS